MPDYLCLLLIDGLPSAILLRLLVWSSKGAGYCYLCHTAQYIIRFAGLPLHVRIIQTLDRQSEKQTIRNNDQYIISKAKTNH